MTNGFAPPSAIHGDTSVSSYGGAPLGIAVPFMLSAPSYTDLPAYWSWRRDVALAATIHREDMWASAVARTATKFAAHGFTIKDSKDSTLRVKNGQALMKQADGGDGWVLFAEKLMSDLLTTDNGVFVRVRRADDQTQAIKVKAYGSGEQSFDEVKVTSSSPGAKITGLYHLDSLRCMRTGNLAYPVRYLPVTGAPQLLRWDQVLVYADQPSPRAELYGVGYSAASRAYKTIAAIAAGRQMFHEFITGTGANKVVFVQGIGDVTLQNLIKAGVNDAQARGLLYYLGTILGAIPSDTPISTVEVILKQLPEGFDWKQYLDDAYLIYANAIGIPVQDIQPLSGQGLGTGTQSVILAEQSRGIGIAAFLKWWEQTVSDRILPATTELAFDDEHDLRDQQGRAQVALTRAQERAARIQSGEIDPPMARQIAADVGDLDQELLGQDATPGGQVSDDEKPVAQATANPAALLLAQGAPTAAPAPAAPTFGAKAAKDDEADALVSEEYKAALEWARKVSASAD